MDKSRKRRTFRPGGYDSLEERVVLSPGGAGALVAQMRHRNAAAVTSSVVRGQLRNQTLGRSAQLLGRRQFALAQRGGISNGFNPVVTALGFSDQTATAAALRATNTATSITGPNLTADATGFSNPNLSVTNLAQAVSSGSTINALGLNSGNSTFNGLGLGNGLFSNGLGFISTQSLLGNLASTVDSSLNLTADDLNGGRVTFGGLTDSGTFGLANPLSNVTIPGFNGGLGLNNGLGFTTTPSTTTTGTPLSNLTSFNVLGLNQGIRNTTGLNGLTLNPTTGVPFGTGARVDPTTGIPSTGTSTSTTGTGTSSTGLITGTG